MDDLIFKDGTKEEQIQQVCQFFWKVVVQLISQEKLHIMYFRSHGGFVKTAANF